MKTRTILILALTAALTLSATACGVNIYLPRTVRGNGSVTEEVRKVDSFDQIDFQGIGNLYVSLGENESLTIEAEDNLLPYLESFVQGERLVLKVENGRNINPTEPVNYYLTIRSLTRVDVSGLGNVELPELETERFRIEISGAGDIEIAALTAESLTANMSGLGNLRINDGQVTSQDVRISGSGKYSARYLESQEANVEISGLGSATVNASEYLDVSISGAGDVEYYGDPEIDKSISGIGRLDKLDD